MDEINLEQSLYLSMYKYNSKSKEISQEQRRIECLERQKNKRHENADAQRNLLDLIEETENEELFSEKTDKSKGASSKKLFKLMHCEWFLESPDDLKENWLVKLCPDGCRVLLIAQRKHTTCFLKDGKIAWRLKTCFPGGGNISPKGLTVLDCVYNKSAKVIYVLDCLYWNSMSMMDSEAQFRFTWLQSKFKEDNLNDQATPRYSFKLIDFIPADASSIQENLMHTLEINENIIPYDGAVFYHSCSHYTFGYTPLALWLPTFAFAEKFHIEVDMIHLTKRPEDYAYYELYLQSFCKKKRRKTRKSRNVDVMDFN